jgi:hypothetical protein
MKQKNKDYIRKQAFVNYIFEKKLTRFILFILRHICIYPRQVHRYAIFLEYLLYAGKLVLNYIDEVGYTM